jgi:hypothetical protein
MEPIEGSETSAISNQTPGKHPKENILLVIYLQLNMFRASSFPSSGATATAVAASGLPSEVGDSSAVGRGRAGRGGRLWARPRPTALLPPRSNGKAEMHRFQHNLQD